MAEGQALQAPPGAPPRALRRDAVADFRWQAEGMGVAEPSEDSGSGESGSISSDDEGAGADCAARTRLRPMKDIWPAEEVVAALRGAGAAAGALALAGRAEEAVAAVGGARAAPLWACWLARPALLQRLLVAGADPHAADDAGRSGLHLASLVGSAECVRLLLQAGAEPTQWDRARRATPLHCAASAKSLACIQELVARGADVNAGIHERSPLHYAVQSEAEDCVRELLERGARPDTPQVFTETPLHVAAALGSSACARLLLRHGADARARLGPARLTALHLAAEDGHAACARALLDHGAPLDAPNQRHQTPLHLACIAQALDTLELLVQRGASTRARDADGRTPLHAALGRAARSPDCARALLEAGADVNLPDDYGYTPVHLAALNEFSGCVALLLEHGGDVTMRTKGGHTALSFMVRRTPDVLPGFLAKLDEAVRVAEHEIGDVDCELKLDFRPLVPAPGRGESALLLALVEVGRRDVLKHPLAETFLHLKWRKIRKFFLASLVYHAVFVLLFSVYIIGVFLPPRSGEDRAVPLEIRLCGYLLLALDLLLLAKELFQVFHNFQGYARQWENWLQWLIIISIFLCSVGQHHTRPAGASPGNSSLAGAGPAHARGDVATWQYHVAALGIFLAWVELMLIVGRFPMFGLYVQMFTTVAMNFSKFLMAYSCLLVAFGLAFSVLFSNSPPFRGLEALLKTVVMMSGELEFEDLFYPADDSALLYPVTTHVLFLAFVLLVTVILTNLLVGLAVSDIQALQESAGLDRLVRQAGLVAGLESMLFSPLLRWAPRRALAVLHRAALLLASPYHWALCVRPNDPRENRIPKKLIASIYKLVAGRKEGAKAARSRQGFPAPARKAGSVLRPRTASELPRGSARPAPELAARVERLERALEARLAALEDAVRGLARASR